MIEIKYSNFAQDVNMYDHVGKHYLFTLKCELQALLTILNYYQVEDFNRRLPLEWLIIESIVAGTLITDIYYMLSEMPLEAL